MPGGINQLTPYLDPQETGWLGAAGQQVILHPGLREFSSGRVLFSLEIGISLSVYRTLYRNGNGKMNVCTRHVQRANRYPTDVPYRAQVSG
jgi:hypothetical protein